MKLFALTSLFAYTAYASCGGRRLEDDEYDPRECWTDLVGWWNAELWVGAAEKGECADPLGAEHRFEIRKIPLEDRDEDNHNIKIGFQEEELLTWSSINYDGFEFKLKIQEESEVSSVEPEVEPAQKPLLESLVNSAIDFLTEPSQMRDVVMHYDDEHERMFLTYTCGETETTIVYKQCDGHHGRHGKGKRCLFYVAAFLAVAAICCLGCVGKHRCKKNKSTVSASTTTSINLTKTIAMEPAATTAGAASEKVTPGGCNGITAVTVAYDDNETTTHTV